MTASTRTTFEIKVSNKLQKESIFVKIQSELGYTKQLASSKYDHDSQNNYDRNEYKKSSSFSNERSNSRYKKQQNNSSNYDNNKFHIKSSSSSTNDVLQHDISANSRGSLNQNASSEHKSDAAAISDAELKETSNEYTKINQLSKTSLLDHKTIDPGFVRIAALQSLHIPVIVENEYQVVYMTVYVTNNISKQLICLANQLQITRQHIVIKRNMQNDIILKPTDIIDEFSNFRSILLKWGIPEYLCDAMKKFGWHNIKLWDDITETHLIEMGFKAGHRALFNDAYNKYKLRKNRISNKLSFKNLLKAWDLPHYLFDALKENGWSDISLWNEIEDDDFKEMNFKRGHTKKFKKCVQDNAHIAEFEKMRNNLKQNKISMLNEEEDDDDDNKSGYDISNTPIFKINTNKVTDKSFEIELDKIKASESYIVSIKESNSNEWKATAEFSQTKYYTVSNLKIDTTYFVRIYAQNAFNKTSDCCKEIQVKTKDENWKNENIPNIQRFKYDVAYNNKGNISLVFYSMNRIKWDSKFNEKFSIEMALSHCDDDIEDEDVIKWKEIAKLVQNTLVYECDIENDYNRDILNIRVKSINDLSYIQYSKIKSFKMSEPMKQKWDRTNYGKSLKFINDTVVTKVNNEAKTFSLCLFGGPITNHICNRYDLHIKIAAKKKASFWLGYVTSKDCVKNWDCGLCGDNRNSIGLDFGLGWDNFRIWDKQNQPTWIAYQADGCKNFYALNLENIRLSFDFQSNCIRLYSDDEQIHTEMISLNDDKIIIPAFATYDVNSIEILKWTIC